MIYICYGMTKSASTFLYQLTEEAFRVAGRKPIRLGPAFRPAGSVDNYFDSIDEVLLQRIVDELGDEIEHCAVVLKTHGPPTTEVAARVARGEIMASALARDPREIALSMADHGVRARRWRMAPFAEIVSPLDAMHSLDNQVESCRAWAAIPGVAVFSYNQLCFDTLASVARLCRQIGGGIDPAQVMRPYRARCFIGQFSKGVALRYREMPEDQQRQFLQRYAAFYQSFALETPTAIAEAKRQAPSPRARGEVAQLFAYLSRRLRFFLRDAEPAADQASAKKYPAEAGY